MKMKRILSFGLVLGMMLPFLELRLQVLLHMMEL